VGSRAQIQPSTSTSHSPVVGRQGPGLGPGQPSVCNHFVIGDRLTPASTSTTAAPVSVVGQLALLWRVQPQRVPTTINNTVDATRTTTTATANSKFAPLSGCAHGIRLASSGSPDVQRHIFITGRHEHGPSTALRGAVGTYILTPMSWSEAIRYPMAAVQSTVWEDSWPGAGAPGTDPPAQINRCLGMCQ
jgi:hypothetical protein